MRTPEELLCSRRWRMRHSIWMLWGVLSLGLFWFVSFAIIGFRTKNRFWIALSALFLALLIVFFSVDAPAKGEPASPMSSLMGFTILASYVGGIIYAWFSNRKWLVWKAHQSGRPWYSSATASPTPDPFQANASPDIDHVFKSLPPPSGQAHPLSTSQVSDAQPSAEPSTSSGRTMRQEPQQLWPAMEPPSTPLELIDLNTAPAETLATLPGLDSQWAAYIVAMRDHSGPFAQASDLVTRAQLPPHLFANLSSRVTVNQPPSPGGTPPPRRMDGRRLEF